jgi:hypothetical protein
VTWCEYANSYLEGWSSGTQLSYNILASAQAACLERDDCGGITYDTEYTLRVGPEIQGSGTGETSWIICETGKTGFLQNIICVDFICTIKKLESFRGGAKHNREPSSKRPRNLYPNKLLRPIFRVVLQPSVVGHF